MARRERKKIAQADMDLTPMIDVVFQLIIFFILTMTITTLTVKKVELPIAETSVEEDTEEDAYMIHLYNSSLKSVDGKPATRLDPAGWHIALPNRNEEFRTVQELADPLTQVVEEYDKSHARNAETGLSEMTLLIRGDMRAPSHFFGVIIESAVKAGIVKLKVSIKPPRDA